MSSDTNDIEDNVNLINGGSFEQVAPKTPTIRVESKRDDLIEGDILKLKCEAEDGEPDGTLTWLKANRGGNEYVPIHLLSTAEKDHSRNLLTSQLDIQLTSDDHLSSYACLATNPGFPASDQRRSEPFHVNITFRPKHIAIHRVQGSGKFTQPNRPADQELVTTPSVSGEAGRPLDSEGQRFPASPRSIAVVAGEMITLICRAGPANPPIALKWRHLSCKPALSSLSTDVATTNYSFLSGDSEANAERVCSEISRFDDVKSLPFEASTLTSKGQVSLIVQNSHHKSIIECSTDGGSPKHTSAWHTEDEEDQLKTQTILNVQFIPNFSKVLDKLSVAVSKYLPQLVVVEVHLLKKRLTQSKE
ncbi:unnamed protein product [Dibothriocephalus latus]|uniref:Ig-like domain-containing protein n=1 Tax=Dibothriocephalus latus TaxID=60516 RepID=A0A3P6SDL4_DIBLA|nr:unnamed protein product [Dibothriocephalus latus]